LINSTLEFQEKLKQARFKIEGKDFLIGMTILNDDKTVISQIQQFFGGNESIYMKDTRIVTTIINKGGGPTIGIRLPSVVSDTVIGKGQPYRGEETVLGNRHLVAYDPIKDNQTGEGSSARSLSMLPGAPSWPP
jgi:methyl-accepting chemotaxis protein